MAQREFDVPLLLQWITALINGLNAGLLGGLTEILVGGTVYKITDLVTALQKGQAMLQAVADAEAALAAAVQNLNDQGAAVQKLIRQSRKSVKGQLGGQNANLPKFGIKPDKTTTPLTVPQKATKVEQNAATRVARRTMGTVQKAKVHGQVPAESPPAAAPAPTASPPAAAPVKTGS